MNNATHIEAVRRQLLKTRYTNEIEFLQKEQPTSDRIKQLKQLSDSIVLINTEPKRTLTDHLDEATKQIYTKKWTYIPAVHRLVKIKEFVKDTVKDEKLCSKIMKDLERYNNEDKLKLKKFVDYDNIKQKIVAMPCLVVDIEKKTFKITL